MPFQKAKTLLLGGCLLMSMVLCGCGGQPLSKREIVRAILLDNQGTGYTACLLLADQNAAEGKPAYKTASATGNTPAAALAAAEGTLQGTPYYGLMDLAALPSRTDWALAQQIGELLYQKAQPAPELSVFILDENPERSWAEQAGSLYDDMKAGESFYKLHCGLQQLFTQADFCAIPGVQATGYDFFLLGQATAPVRCRGTVPAQLAAVLCGQAQRIIGPYGGGSAYCSAKASMTATGQTVQLHLRELELSSLQDSPVEESALQAQFEHELQTAFAACTRWAALAGQDPFRLDFWQGCRSGPGAHVQNPTLEILVE